MKRALKKAFIPHPENNFAPYLLRERSVLLIASIALVILPALVILQTDFAARTGFLAEVLPNVLIDLGNKDRAENDLPPLSVSPLLEEAARQKALDMAAKQYFSHVSPAGVTPWVWFRSIGYPFRYAGENLAIDFVDSEIVEQAWMNSPTHRANILNEKFTEIGVSAVTAHFNGKETTIVVQLFGTPKAELAGTAPPSPSPVAVPPAPLPPTVLGAEAKAATAEDEAPITAEDAANLLPSEPAPAISISERAIASPRRAITIAYGAIGALILLAVLSSLFIEMRRQHPKHIAYGIILLALTMFLMYIFRSYLLGGAVIG